MPDNSIWPWVLLFLLLGLVAVVYYATRARNVPEGYVAVIEKMNKFHRLAGPGLYWLGPLEEEVARLYVRQREAAMSVPNVFTDGGLAVTVQLRYAYSLAPERMNKNEIYYTEDERKQQQSTLVKRAFSTVLQKLAQTPTPRLADPDRVDLVYMFSPFLGPKEGTLHQELDTTVRAELSKHGIQLSQGQIVIVGLTLPPGVAAAYEDLLRTDVTSTLRADFIQRMRAAAPELSDEALAQLYDLTQNRPGDIRSLVAGGTLNTQDLLRISKIALSPHEGSTSHGSRKEKPSQGSDTGGQSIKASQRAKGPPLAGDEKSAGNAGVLLDRAAQTISAAYTRDELRRVLRLGMELNFDDLVAERPYAQQIFELVSWADRHGRFQELLTCAYDHNSGNSALAGLVRELDGHQPDAPPPIVTPLPAPASAVDGGSHQIYLAYSRKDSDFMQRLRADLLAAGLRIWVDDRDLEPGTPGWQRAIRDAIRDAHCMIVVLSPDACESKWVTNEITLAELRSLRIFPVLARGEIGDAVPLSLLHLQYVDARRDYTAAVQGRLLPAVRRYLSSPPA